MDTKRVAQKVQVDNYTRVCLGLITVLLTLLVAGIWVELPTITAARAAEQPWADASEARKAMAEAQIEANAKLDEIIQLLTSGEVKVQVVDGSHPAPAPGAMNHAAVGAK